ncbi:hypothetical protein D9M71_735320 [compost metagenome]
MMRTAPLLAPYMVCAEAPTRPATEQALITDPRPCCAISGMTCFMPRKTLVTLIAIIRFQSSRVVCANGLIT